MKDVSALSLKEIATALLPYAARRWREIVYLAGTTSLVIAVSVAKPWPMKFIVDHALLGAPLPAGLTGLERLAGMETPTGRLWWGVAATVAVFGIGWALMLMNSLAQVRFGQRASFDLSSVLFGHLQGLSLRFHARRSTGDVIRRVTADCACISNIVKDALLPAVSSLLTLCVIVAIMWQINAVLTLLAIAVVPPLVIILRHYAGPMMARSYDQEQAEGRIYADVEQTFSAIPVVQIFRRESMHDRHFGQHTASAIAAAMRATDVQLRFKVLVGLCTAVGTAALIWAGSRQVLGGTMSLGTLMVFLAYLGALYRPIESIVYSSFAVHGAAGGARRVVELLRAEQEIADRRGALPLESVRGDISFENVHFGYSEDRNALDGISLEIAAGERVAIVGRSGAGKTTLASLVPRLIDPQTGTVRIDGRDSRDLALASVRQNVSIVLQDSFLFPVSVAENIAYGRPEATREQIISAAQAANAHEFIGQLPEGYDTVVGERGATLSGGQRQRIAIARALLRDTPILILDEPTSHLDPATEQAVLEALNRLIQGRTTLIIAHRLSTARDANRIIVMDQGRVVEQGSHDDLLRTNGIYSRFWSAWLRGQEEPGVSS